MTKINPFDMPICKECNCDLNYNGFCPDCNPAEFEVFPPGKFPNPDDILPCPECKKTDDVEVTTEWGSLPTYKCLKCGMVPYEEDGYLTAIA